MLQNIFKKKQEDAPSDPIRLSLDEKKFYLSLYNTLPVGFSLAFHSDIINLNSLISQNKNNFSKSSLFLEKFSKEVVDFIVLDKKLQSCAIILFDHPVGSKTHTEFYETLIEMEIPVFIYTNKEKYDFRDLLLFVKN